MPAGLEIRFSRGKETVGPLFHSFSALRASHGVRSSSPGKLPAGRGGGRAGAPEADPRLPMNTSQNSPAGSPPDTATADFRWAGHMANGTGATYGLPPASSLHATANELVLSGPLGTFRFARSEVLKLGRGGMYPWFFSGIRIHHRNAGYPAELQFKAQEVARGEVIGRLRGLGYPVA